MNTNAGQGIMLGTAMAALGYALYKHFKPTKAAAKPAAPSTPAALTPDAQAHVDFETLLEGTAYDVSPYEDVPNYSEVTGDTGVDSVVRIKNGEWWQQ